MDWDEEFAIQDFLKNELAERNCQVHDGQREERLEETGDKITDRGEEEDAEERWTVVDSGGEGDVRDTSTPLSVVTVEAQSGQGTVGEGRGEWGQELGITTTAHALKTHRVLILSWL